MKRSKKDDVLRHLQTHKRGITPETAWKKYSVYRLADTIFKLKKEGHDIETIMESNKDKYGVNTFARYVLRKSA